MTGCSACPCSFLFVCYRDNLQSPTAHTNVSSVVPPLCMQRASRDTCGITRVMLQISLKTRARMHEGPIKLMVDSPQSRFAEEDTRLALHPEAQVVCILRNGLLFAFLFSSGNSLVSPKCNATEVSMQVCVSKGALSVCVS